MPEKLKIAFISACVWGFGTVCLCAQDKEQSGVPPGREIVFSEFCLTPPPGTATSWLELYNRSMKEADLTGAEIVCNGETVAAFPADFSLPAHALLLVRFSTEKATGARPTEMRGNWVFMQVAGKVAALPGDTRRAAGYMALQRPSEEDEPVLLDYVRWGWTKLPEDAAYQKRAEEAGAWHKYQSDPIYIALSPAPGEPLLPQDPVALSRLTFRSKSDWWPTWLVLPLADATPGQGNTSLPIPTLMGPSTGETCFREDGGISIGFRDQGLTYLRHLEWTWVVQLATDPHFEHIVSSVNTKGRSCSFKSEDLPENTYYMRVQWRSERGISPWSKTVCVFLK